MMMNQENKTWGFSWSKKLSFLERESRFIAERLKYMKTKQEILTGDRGNGVL